MDIVYSFDMSGEIANFKRMPKDVQSRIKRNVVYVIYESFVVPGDQDYLMARLLAQNGLPRGFYWAAAQAIEKYLKAFLLINGMGVINFKGHPVKNLFDAAAKIDISFADLNVLPHPSIPINVAVAEHLKRFTVRDFICELEKHGNPDNRYNAFGVKYNTGHPCAMDSLSFHIRGRIGKLPIINKSFKRLKQDLINTFEKITLGFRLVEIFHLSRFQAMSFPYNISLAPQHWSLCSQTRTKLLII